MTSPTTHVSASGHHEIDLKTLKKAVNAVLDHIIEDLRMAKVRIEKDCDHYWEVPAAQLFDMSTKPPVAVEVGRLSDDVDFVSLIHRGQASDVAYNLVHVAPLLRYLGEKVKK